MLHLVMKTGSSIPAHVHWGVAEVLYVVEGDFINEGKTYAPGTSLHIKAGTTHGPHSTKDGCTLLVVGKAVVGYWRPESRSSSLIALIGGPHRQCSRNTGTSACSSMERVQPPKNSCCSGPVL